MILYVSFLPSSLIDNWSSFLTCLIHLNITCGFQCETLINWPLILACYIIWRLCLFSFPIQRKILSFLLTFIVYLLIPSSPFPSLACMSAHYFFCSMLAVCYFCFILFRVQSNEMNSTIGTNRWLVFTRQSMLVLNSCNQPLLGWIIELNTDAEFSLIKWRWDSLGSFCELVNQFLAGRMCILLYHQSLYGRLTEIKLMWEFLWSGRGDTKQDHLVSLDFFCRPKLEGEQSLFGNFFLLECSWDFSSLILLWQR